MSRPRIRVLAAAALVAVSGLVAAAPAAAPSAESGVVLADPERCC